MVMSYEQWQLILSIIDEEVNLSKDNIIGKIKELLKKVRILEPEETSRMLEEISHELEISSKIPRVQETQEPLKKRLKVVNVPQTPEEAKKILKETGISNAQKVVKRILERLGVKETSGESKAVVLEDVLDARKISEKVPMILDTKNILETLEVLKRASGNVYREWEKAQFDVNHWFTVNYFNERFPYTLFYLAIDFKLENVLIALLEVKESNINTESPFSKWTALHWATERGDIRVVLELTKRGANVNQLDSSERTTLYRPAVNGDIEVTKILVKNKANVNAEDLARLTALYEAARNSHKEVVKFLMNSGADVKKNGELKLTPLHIAVANVDEAMVDCIIQNDKNIEENIEAVDVFGWTPLYWAAARNNTSILEIILQAISRCRASVDIEDKLIGRSPLHIAATNDNVEAVELLINYGADINYQDAWGWTPFNCAAARGNREVMNYLIAHGASIETNDPQKILLSIHPYNCLEAVTTIIQLGIWKDVIKLMGTDFLRYAAGHGDILTVRDLLASGVNANASNDLGSTALHEAAKGGHSEVAEILILCGATVDAQDNLKTTPLNYAVESHHWEAAEILRSYGADPSLQDNCGETVISLAKRKKTSKFLDAVEKVIQVNCTTTVRHSPYRLGYTNVNRGRVTHLTNGIARLQLGPSAELCEGQVTPLANKIANMQLNPSTEADECNDRWSYRGSSRATAVQKCSSFYR